MPPDLPPHLPTPAQPLVLSALGVRRAIGVCGLILPVALGPLGWLIFDIPFQDNLSGYVHTPLRDVFVGILFALGVLLFCYRGHDRLENCTANLAAAFALGLALFPLDPDADPLAQRSLVGFLHTVCGGGFFLTLAVYSLWHFPSFRSSSSKESEPHPFQRNLVYCTTGLIILLSMLAMGAYLLLFPPNWKQWANAWNLLFWLEWIAVWSFAAAWLTKGRVILADFAIDLMAATQERLLPASRSSDRV